jgi:hypothetical protein
MKYLLIIGGVVIFLYFTLALEVSTTSQAINDAFNLPIEIKLSDILRKTGQSNLPIQISIKL